MCLWAGAVTVTVAEYQVGLSFLLAATFTHVFARSAKDDDDVDDGLT